MNNKAAFLFFVFLIAVCLAQFSDHSRAGDTQIGDNQDADDIVYSLQEKPYDLFTKNTRKYTYRKKTSFTSYARGEYSKLITKFNNDKDDVEGYILSVEVKASMLPDLLQKALFYSMAGGAARQQALRLEQTETLLEKKWFDASERFATKAVILAEMAKVEAQAISSSGMVAIGMVCQSRDDEGDEAKAIKAFKQGMMATARLELVSNHINHQQAFRSCLHSHLGSTQGLMQTVPDEQLSEILVRPINYDSVLKRDPNRGRKVSVVSPLTNYHDQRAISRLQAMAADYGTPEEKEVLLKAAKIIQVLRKRESDRIRKDEEERYPEKPSMFEILQAPKK